MSSLGYAIVFLFCTSDPAHCEMSGVRAIRFADPSACQTALADVAGAMRTHGGASTSMARCRSLDELCRANLASVPMLPRSGLSARRHNVAARRESSFAAVLDILCHPDPGPGLGCAGE